MKTLVTGALGATAEDLRRLEALGLEITLHPDERAPVAAPERYEAVICNGLFLYQDIDLFSSLRFIQLTSAGTDRVPMEKIRERGIELHNARGVYSAPMAEFAVCGVLQIYKQSAFFRENQKAHRWEKHRGLRELGEKNVCVIGCGSVGDECARRFAAFGCRVGGVDLFPRADAPLYPEGIRPVDELDAALAQADVAVLTLPLTDRTRGMMDSRRFAAMKAGAVLVNIARGAIVDTEALLQALPKLGGAVLDVFETEPLDENSPLWDAQNVILTPHNSFVGEGNHERLMDLCSSFITKSFYVIK